MTLPAVGEAAGPVGLQGSALLSPVPGSPVLRSPVLRSPVRTIGAREFDFDRQIAVMAIVNRTPDSFYDRGRTFALDRAVEAALAAVGDGADWVDIGGVKFAPGAPVPVEVEAERVLPLVRAVHEASDVVISVDTFHTAVARQAIVAGASVINDTTGLSDPELAHVVADSDATLVIAHSLARPRTAYPRPEYADVAAEVSGFLRSRVELAVALGVPEERIVVDPGHDLNKNHPALARAEPAARRDLCARVADPGRALEQGLHWRDPRPTDRGAAGRVARRGRRLRAAGRADRACA